MLTYNMDVEKHSRWLRTTPGPAALAQPYYCTEAGLFYGQERFSTARTDKESYLLFYTLKGAGLIEQNDQQVLLPAGYALLLNCRTPQSYCTAPGQSCWHHYWVHLDGAGVAAMEQVLIPQQLAAVPFPAEKAALFDRVLDGVERQDIQAVLNTAFALHELLNRMAQARLDAIDQTASNRALVERAAAYLRAHYAEPLCLDALLEIAPVSKSYLLRLFRRYMGTTPYNFLLCTRVTQAKELLVLTDLPVKEIARRTGFSGESNFSTRFSAMAGQSPLQYRKSALRQSD